MLCLGNVLIYYIDYDKILYNMKSNLTWYIACKMINCNIALCSANHLGAVYQDTTAQVKAVYTCMAFLICCGALYPSSWNTRMSIINKVTLTVACIHCLAMWPALETVILIRAVTWLVPAYMVLLNYSEFTPSLYSPLFTAMQWCRFIGICGFKG